jgi:hypothetical protein
MSTPMPGFLASSGFGAFFAADFTDLLDFAAAFVLDVMKSIPVTRHYYGYLRAFAACAGDFQSPAHFFDPLAHSGETYTVVPLFHFEAITVIAKFQTKFLCLVP